MTTFKGFRKGLICRGFQFKPFVENVCPGAQAHCYGFHSAQNPLDVLTYYPDTETSEYWLCEASGDIDEDGRDSKVSSTVLVPMMQIGPEELIRFGMIYLELHPEERKGEEKLTASYGYAVAVGEHPTAKGRFEGDILAFFCTKTGKWAEWRVGDGGTKPKKWYDMDKREVK